uniref:Uncharacterized protein n=1 Tax=Glossina austeni TaxID=7395 RepID=A0A1A9VQX1_GLOAU
MADLTANISRILGSGSHIICDKLKYCSAVHRSAMPFCSHIFKIAQAAPNRNHDFSTGSKQSRFSKHPGTLTWANSRRNVFSMVGPSVVMPSDQRATVLRASNLQRVSGGNSSRWHQVDPSNLQSQRSRNMNSKSCDSQTTLSRLLIVLTIAITISYRTVALRSKFRASKHLMISGRKRG